MTWVFVFFYKGSLTTSYSTTTYYKDIDTLEELDKSGLPIGTTSASLKDIFGEGGTPVLRSLISKFKLFTGKVKPTIDRTAEDRDICCIEREADINVIIAVIRLRIIFFMNFTVQKPITHYRNAMNEPMERFCCMR